MGKVTNKSVSNMVFNALKCPNLPIGPNHDHLNHLKLAPDKIILI